MKTPLSRSTSVLGWLLLQTSALAYPGAPSTWGTWNYFEDTSVRPTRIVAKADPDGRLRTGFNDLKTPNSAGLYDIYLQSFRPYFQGTNRQHKNEIITVNPQAYDACSLEALQKRNRLILANVLDNYQNLKICFFGQQEIGGILRFSQEGNYTSRPKYFDVSRPGMPMANRPVIEDGVFRGVGTTLLDFYAIPNLHESSAELQARDDGPTFSYSENATDDLSYNAKFFPQPINLSSSAPAGWLTGRTFTGGDIAVTADRRNFYILLTSQQGASPNETEEVRLYRINTGGVPADDRFFEINFTTSIVVSSGPMGGSAPAYPQIHCTSTGEPKWITFENGDQTLTAMQRTPIAGFPFTIQGGYTAQLNRSRAIGCSAELDRLDRLHLAYQEIQVLNGFSLPSKAAYVRETASGGFDDVLLSRCTGAPAVAVGPGGYPYVVYNGRGPSGTGPDHLIVAYPDGLASAYTGDYEDHDKDGRIGLIELAQGSDDHYAEPADMLDPYHLSTEFYRFALPTPTLRFQTTFRLNLATFPLAGTTSWTMLDRGDTLTITPVYSANGMRSWLSSGFSVIYDNYLRSGNSAPIGRKIILRDTATTAAFPKQFYRLQVTRTPGPP